MDEFVTKKIEPITISGCVFPVTQIERVERGVKHVSFRADFGNGQQKVLRVSYETDMAEALIRSHGLDVEDELFDIVIKEIKMELFEHVHRVNMVDVVEGKHPELLAEYASQLDINYLNPEVQEKYIDVIADAVKRNG